MELLNNSLLLPNTRLKLMVIHLMVLLLLQPIRDVVGGEKLGEFMFKKILFYLK